MTNEQNKTLTKLNVICDFVQNNKPNESDKARWQHYINVKTLLTDMRTNLFSQIKPEAGLLDLM